MNQQNPVDNIPQLDAMRMGIDYRFVISVRQFTLPVRPLTIGEKLQVATSVMAEMAKMPPAARNAVMEHTLTAKETLKKASTSDVGKSDESISDYILDRMTSDELLALFSQYVANEDRVNPRLEMLDKKSVQILVDELKKKDQATLGLQLIELSLSELTSLVHFFLTNDV